MTTMIRHPERPMDGYQLVRCANRARRTAGDRTPPTAHTQMMSDPLDWAVRDQPLGARPAPINDPAVAYPPAYGAPPAQPPRQRTGLVITLIAVAVVLLAVGGGLIAYRLTRPAKPSATQQAIAACEASVRGLLKAPATAQFSGETAARVGTDAYDVAGDVDAQNSFGALLRQRWTCSAVRFANGWDGTARLLG